jgi:hypothetical protein
MRTIERNIAVSGNMEGEQVAMTIDAASLKHLMTVLSKLYSDPELAVVREYATNAWDSHVEAGISIPIEVTTPGPLAPFYTIRDYGVGMDAETIRNVYSKYGASTKRESNDFNGQLGLGSKSAFAYTSQFTVVGVKNGIRTEVLVSRASDGAATMTIVDEEPTDEANGVKIQVPVQRHNGFAHKAAQFFAHWKPGTVLLDGRDPSNPPASAITLNDRISLFKTGDAYSQGQDIVLMGNVAYPHNLGLGLPRGFAAYVEVGIGEVEMTPSREALEDSPHTRKAVEAIQVEVTREIERAIQAAVDKAGSHREALRIRSEWSDLAKNRNLTLTYQGEHIPHHVTIPGTFKTQDGQVFGYVVPKHSYVMSEANRSKQVMTEWAMDGVWLEGYDAAKFTAPMKKKLLQWAEKHAPTAERFILCDHAPKDTPWITAANVHQWADVKAEKLPRNAVSAKTGRPTGSYEVFDATARRKTAIVADQIDTSRPIYYVNTSTTDYTSDLDVIFEAEPNAYLFTMPERRIAKFCRDFPTAATAQSRVQGAYEAWKKALPSHALSVMSMSQAGRARACFQKMDASRLLDPEIKAAIRLSKIEDVWSDAWRAFYRAGAKLDLVIPTYVNPLDKYPLSTADNYYRWDPTEHEIRYFNEAYKGGWTA